MFETDESTGRVAATPELTRWLTTRAGLTPVSLRPLSAGRSNQIFEVLDSDGRRIIMRCPRPTRADDSSTLEREWLILSALGSTTTSAVPVPAVFGLSTDPNVWPMPFLAMEHVDGLIGEQLERSRPPAWPVLHRAIGDLVRVLKALHTFDYRAAGLQRLSRASENRTFVQRQLARLAEYWRPSGPGSGVGLAVHDRLAAAAPRHEAACLVHGDFRLGNTILDDSGQIRAVLDWELATIGDPLTDFGWLISRTLDLWRGTLQQQRGFVDLLTSGFFDTARTAGHRDADLHTLLNVYLAFSHWKRAAIARGVLERNRQQGHAGDATVLATYPDEIARELVAAERYLDGDANKSIC